MSDERTDAVEAVALWLAGEDGDLEDFPTNAGHARDYQMDRARNIVAVVAPFLAGSGEAERLAWEEAQAEVDWLREDRDYWHGKYVALRAARPDAERVLKFIGVRMAAIESGIPSHANPCPSRQTWDLMTAAIRDYFTAVESGAQPDAERAPQGEPRQDEQ